MIDDLELLRLIENNARLSSEEIAVMLGTTAADVEAEIKRLKDENIILGYNTIINWEKQAPDNCIGMIEVRITPVKNKGYDHIAQILSKYDKVTACYLMSGGFDLMIIYEDRTLRDIANGDQVAKIVVNSRTYQVKLLQEAGLWIFKDITQNHRGHAGVIVTHTDV